MAGLALAIASCASPPAAVPVRAAADVTPACREAAGLRARVAQLVAQGKLERTVRVIHEADLLCPTSARETRGALLDALEDLGHLDAAQELARAILSTERTSDRDLDHARGALRGIAEELARETPRRSTLETATDLFARAQARKGTPEGQRLLDRAVAVLERDGATMAVDVQWPGYGGAAWLPDGRLVVSLGEKQSRIVRVDTGEVTPLSVEAWLLAPNESPQPPIVSPGGRFVIVDAARGEPGVYRTDGGQQVRLIDAQSQRVRWSPDGRSLAWAHRAEVELLALDSNDLRELVVEPAKLGAASIASIAIGDRAAVALTSDGGLHFWELPSRRYIGAAQAGAAKSDEARRLEMSPDGTAVAAWVDGPAKRPEVALFDTATGRRVAVLRDARCAPVTFAMHPSKPELAMGAAGAICFWDTASRTLRRVMRPDVMRAIHMALTGADGPGAASPPPKEVRDLPFEFIHWEGAEPKIGLAISYVLGDTRFDDAGTPDTSPLDPRITANADGPVVKGSANVLAGARRRAFIGAAERWENLAVSPDGRYVIERDGAGRMWDAASGRVVRRFGEHRSDERLLWTRAGLTRVADPTGSAATPTPSPGGRYTAVARPPHGEIDIVRVSDGAQVATVYPLPDDDGAVVRDAEGRVELLPDDARTRRLLLCHVRDVVLPADACEERLVTAGVWTGVLEAGVSPGGP